jgi:hypothetical protein
MVELWHVWQRNIVVGIGPLNGANFHRLILHEFFADSGLPGLVMFVLVSHLFWESYFFHIPLT